MGSYEGRVVLVTGVGKPGSLGCGVARAFADEGASIAVCGQGAGAREVARSLEASDAVRAVPLVADGADADAATAVVQQVIDACGRIDVLVNCGQLAKVAPLVSTSGEDFDAALRTGPRACFNFMRACHPHLREHAGSVINFASGAAASGSAGLSALAAAKEAVRGLSRVAATEWGPDGITVNVVCALAQTSQAGTWGDEFPAERDELLSSIPMGRLGDAQADVGRICVFLGSKDAGYLTGQTIYLQGGLGLHP